jgi:hypothetical protein
MAQGLLTLLVVAPVIFWAAYPYNKDRALPKPPRHLLVEVRL